MSDCICPDYPTAVHSSCPEHPNAVEHMLKGLQGVVTAAADQAQAMTNAELGDLLLTGKWTTLEVHEAGRRLRAGVVSRG